MAAIGRKINLYFFYTYARPVGTGLTDWSPLSFRAASRRPVRNRLSI